MKRKFNKSGLIAGFMLCLLLCFAPGLALAAVWDGTADISWYDAAKTEFEISTAEQLAGLGDILAGSGDIERDSFAGKTIRLTADIDLDNKLWTPLGRSYGWTFDGVFDGQGHKINNLYVHDEQSDNNFYGGLFVNLGGEIKNLEIAGGKVQVDGGGTAGAFAATMSEKGLISGCINRAAVSASADANVGGICGKVSGSGKILSCANYGEISSKNGQAGGMAAIGERARLWGCYNSGSVKSELAAGGLLGSEAEAWVTDCYNLGKVSGGEAEKSYAGGLIGRSLNGTAVIVSSYSKGEVAAKTANRGLICGSAAKCYGVLAQQQGGLTAFGGTDNSDGVQILSAAGLKGAAEKLGDSFVSGDNNPVLRWQQGEQPEYDELADLRPVEIIDYSASGFTLVLNKLVKYENLSADLIKLTARAGGAEQPLYNLTVKTVVLPYNGKYVSGLQYSFLSMGASRGIKYLAEYRGAEVSCGFTSPASSSWLDYAAASFAGGDGTAKNPYLIATPEHLARLPYLAKASKIGFDSYFALTADLDMGGKVWQNADFVGFFDGRGHTISNLSGAPLFDKVRGANEIANLILRSVTLAAAGNKQEEGAQYFAGALANSVADTNLTNCHIDGLNITGSGNVGGLAGRISSNDGFGGGIGYGFVQVNNCSVKNARITGDSVGGLFGAADFGNYHNMGSVRINNCCFEGEISGKVCGGLLGAVHYVNGILVNNCYVSGTVSGSGDGVGGLIGKMDTDSDKYLGDDGIKLTGNVVLLSALESQSSNFVSSVSSDMGVLLGSAKNAMRDNYVAAALTVRGKAAAAEDSVPFALAAAADLAEQGFWQKLGYDFSAGGAWRWDTSAKLPVLKADELCYVKPDIAQPAAATAYINQPACFVAKAIGGTGKYSYQWQYKTGNKDWRDIDKANDTLLTVGCYDGYANGTEFRCMMIDPAGRSLASQSAPLRISGSRLDAGLIQKLLLEGYRQRGSLTGAKEAFAVLAAGGDPAAFAYDLPFEQVYGDDTGYYAVNPDYYSAMLDCYALGENIRDYTAVGPIYSENWDWLEVAFAKQREDGEVIDYNSDAMLLAMEVYFDGSPWGNEQTGKQFGRDGAISSLLGRVLEDEAGGSYFSPSGQPFNSREAYRQSFDCWQADFVLLMCRLADDPKWGAQAQAAVKAVLDGMIGEYQDGKLQYTRSLGNLLSCLVAAAENSDTEAAAQYRNIAADIIANDIQNSLASGGGFSKKTGEHDLSADPAATTAVLLGVSDYLRGSAFITHYVYDVPAELAVPQVLANLRFAPSIAGDLAFEAKGAFGTELSWQSSNPAAISPEGKVNRTAERQQVKITVTAAKGGYAESRDYLLTVRAIGADDHDDVAEALAYAKAELENYTEAMNDIKLPESLVDGVSFVWSSSAPDIISADGKLRRPAAALGDKTVKLTVTAKKGAESASYMQDILVYAESDLSRQEGKLREGYLISRSKYLSNRNISEYWNVFAAYAVLGDYINKENGYTIKLAKPDATWYGTQYGATVMAIVAMGENPYNYNGVDWVAEVNKNYGGEWAAPLYTALAMEAAGANPAVYTNHSQAGSISATRLTQSMTAGIDIAGWAGVLLAEHLGRATTDAYADYFVNYLRAERPVDINGNFASGNYISTGCGILGLSALYWAGVEQADPLADKWINQNSGKGIIDAVFDATWANKEQIAGYSNQMAVAFGDLYNIKYLGGKPSWLAIAVNKDKLNAQIAKAAKLLAERDKYTEESIAAVEAALAGAKAISADRLNAKIADYGKEYYDLYDAVRFAAVK